MTRLSPIEVAARLAAASAASDLRATERLSAKIDMSPRGIARRLREASELLAVCQRLASRAT